MRSKKIDFILIILICSLLVISSLPFLNMSVPEVKASDYVAIYEENFNLGTSRFDGLTQSGGTFTTHDNYGYVGSQCANVSVNSGNGNTAYGYENITAQTTIYVHGAVKLGTLPDGTDDHWRLFGISGGVYAKVKNSSIDTSDEARWTMYYRNGAGYTEAATYNTTLPEIGRWYEIEVAIHVADGTAGWAKMWLNDVLIYNITGIDTDDGGTSLDTLRVGDSYSWGNVAHWFLVDGIIVSTTKIGFIDDVNSIRTANFESNDLTELTGTYTNGDGVVAVTTGDAITGSYSLNCSDTVGYTNFAEALMDIQDVDQLYAFANVTYSALPASGRAYDIMYICVSWDSYSILRLGIMTNGTGSYYSVVHRDTGGTTTTYLSSPTPTAGSLQAIEMFADSGNGDGSVEIWINGTSIFSQSSLDNDDYGDLGIVVFAYRSSSGAAVPVDVIFDNIKLSRERVYTSTTIFTANFDDGTLDEYTSTNTGNDGVIVTTNKIVHNGSYAVKTYDTLWSGEGYGIYSHGSHLTSVYTSGYFKFDTLPTASTNFYSILGLRDMQDFTDRSSVSVYHDGSNVHFRISMTDGTASIGSTDVTTGIWYFVEEYIDFDEGIARLKINGETEALVSDGITGETVAYFKIGLTSRSSTAQTYSFFHDTISIAVTEQSATTATINHLVADFEGTETVWTEVTDNGSLDFNNTTLPNGGFESLMANVTAGSTSYTAYAQYQLAENLTEFRLEYQVAIGTARDLIVQQIKDSSGNTVSRMIMNSASDYFRFYAYIDDVWTNAYIYTTVDADTYYNVTVEGRINATTGYYKVWIDENLGYDNIGVDTSYETRDHINIVQFGAGNPSNDAGDDGIVYHDDINLLSVTPTNVLTEDWEDGDSSGWTSGGSGSAEVQSNTVISGTYSLNLTATDPDSITLTSTNGHNLEEVYIRFKAKFDVLPDDANDNFMLMKVYGGSSEACRFTIQNYSGQLRFNVAFFPWVTYGQYNYNFTTGVEYNFEYAYLVHGSTGFHKIWLDGELVISEADMDTSSIGNFDKIWLGFDPAGYGGSIFVDDIVISTQYIGAIIDANSAPVNVACSITNIDDTDNLYAQLRTYTISYEGTDADSNIVTIDFTLQTGGATERITFRWTQATNSFSELSGTTSSWTLVTGSCSSTEAGTSYDLTIAFTPEFNATEESDLDIKVVSTDSSAETDTDTYDLNYDVITNLVISGFTLNDDRGDTGQALTGNGTVYYANDPASSTATTFYPPDAEFTSVSIYDDWNNNEGSDTGIVNGFFEINLTANSTVGLNTYNPFINMLDNGYTDAEESVTDTFIADNIVVTEKGVTDSWTNINEYEQFYYKFRSEYDNTVIESGTVTLNSTDTLTWDATDSRWELNTTSSSADSKTLYPSSINWDTYGITAISDQSSNSTSIIWDNLIVTLTPDGTSRYVPQDVNFTVTITREYDNSDITSAFTYNVTRDDVAFENPHTTLTFTDSSSTSTSYSYNITSVEDETYDITSFTTITPVTITWASYSVTISPASASLLSGERITFELTIASANNTLTEGEFIANLSRDGDMFREGWTSLVYTDTEYTGTSHHYSILNLTDADGTTLDFSANTAVVVWQNPSGETGGPSGDGDSDVPSDDDTTTPDGSEPTTEGDWLNLSLFDIFLVIAVIFASVFLIFSIQERREKPEFKEQKLRRGRKFN